MAIRHLMQDRLSRKATQEMACFLCGSPESLKKNKRNNEKCKTCLIFSNCWDAISCVRDIINIFIEYNCWLPKKKAPNLCCSSELVSGNKYNLINNYQTMCFKSTRVHVNQCQTSHPLSGAYCVLFQHFSDPAWNSILEIFAKLRATELQKARLSETLNMFHSQSSFSLKYEPFARVQVSM